jgi:hypothetical protein
MWQEVNEVMSRPKLVCSGCFCTHMYTYVLMYARSYVRNLSIQLYLNVCNLYVLLFVNYVHFCLGTCVCNFFKP